jgi:thiol-disulfide isomerase/thioredoxin
MNFKKKISAAIVLLVLVGITIASGLPSRLIQAQDDSEFTYAGDVDAPAFPDGLEWLNVSEPLSIADLEGKIVLLDFWTYGCINCMHIIPDLHRLEAEFGDDLVVIGVHSAKFENEGQIDNIRNIVQRYEVTHPVVNDVDFRIWQQYGVNAWPTLVVIDPLGKVVGGNAGEGVYPIFQPVLSIMQQEYGDAGLLDDTPLPMLAPELDNRVATALNYPGKVLADPATNRLIISDTTNHRLIVTDLNNVDNFVVIGSGQAGFANGTFEESAFDGPQGVALDGDLLYVADTNNHAIRVIDLKLRTVATLTGTGEQATRYPPAPGRVPNVALSSPWDLTLNDGSLYIAMAGPHQLWRIDLQSGEVVPYAGSGREGIVDAPLGSAELAQPSGIDTDGELLYFADAEVSAIRSASLDRDGDVNTIVGTGLFDFGDADGVGDEVLLQHALGVTVGPDGLLYVADTYNNKIKVINPETRESTTLAGNGEPDFVDGTLEEARFYEPGGIDYADGKLYIADTNNHAIRIIDLAEGTVSTVTFSDPTVLIPIDSGDDATVANPDDDTTFYGLEDTVIELDAQTVTAGEGELVFDVTMPDDYKLNDQAPFTVISPEDDTVSISEEFLDYREVLPELPLHIPVTFNEGTTVYSTDLTIYWCEAVRETLCFVERVTLSVPVTVSADGETSELLLSYDLVPPDAASDFD